MTARPTHARGLTGRRSSLVVKAGLVLVLAGCGDSSTEPTAATAPVKTAPGTTSGPSASMDDLIAKLSAAGPQGNAGPEQAAATAVRQQQIVRRHAAGVPAGSCREALDRVAAAYAAFARAAKTLSSATSPEEYASAAQQVSTRLSAAESACGA